MLVHQELFDFGVKVKEPNYIYYRYFIRPLAFAIYVFYFNFLINFLETATNFVRFHWYIKLAKNILIFFSLVFLVLNLFANDSPFANQIYQIFNLFIFIVSISLIILLWKIRTALSKFILRGALAVLIGALISNLISILGSSMQFELSENFMITVAIGVLIELYFFNSGLSYKSRQVERNMITSQQRLIDELEKSKALEVRLGGIRQKISRDLHDELGATLTGIAMYSYITKTQLKDRKYTAVNNSLDVIRENASDMVAKLSDIVWEVNPVKDQFSFLLERLKEFAIQLTSVKQIELDFSFPEAVELLSLPMEYRRNIHMICKEAINNAVKYSEANLLQIKIDLNDSKIEIRITDSGKGFNLNQEVSGNGLLNMRKRAEEINAALEISSANGCGTEISLICKIT